MALGARQIPKGFVCIVIERCKGCGFCVEFCPTHVLALSSALNSKGYHPPQVIHADQCSGCDLCGMYCPDFAIVGGKFDVTEQEPFVGVEAHAAGASQASVGRPG